MSASPGSVRRYEALTCAAELYEEARANGALRGEAFEVALRQLRDAGVRGLPRPTAPPQSQPVIVPAEVTALVIAHVQRHGGRAWQRIYRDLLAGDEGGRRQYPVVANLRAELGWQLHGLGYADKVIALALGVDRTTVVTARRKFRGRAAVEGGLEASVAA